MKNIQKWIGIAMAAAVSVMSLAGCSQETGSVNVPGSGRDSQTAGITGTVATDGSTSMEKVIGALGEAFENQNSGVLRYRAEQPAVKRRRNRKRIGRHRSGL